MGPSTTTTQPTSDARPVALLKGEVRMESGRVATVLPPRAGASDADQALVEYAISTYEPVTGMVTSKLGGRMRSPTLLVDADITMRKGNTAATYADPIRAPDGAELLGPAVHIMHAPNKWQVICDTGHEATHSYIRQNGISMPHPIEEAFCDAMGEYAAARVFGTGTSATDIARMLLEHRIFSQTDMVRQEAKMIADAKSADERRLKLQVFANPQELLELTLNRLAYTEPSLIMARLLIRYGDTDGGEAIRALLSEADPAARQRTLAEFAPVSGLESSFRGRLNNREVDYYTKTNFMNWARVQLHSQCGRLEGNDHLNTQTYVTRPSNPLIAVNALEVTRGAVGALGMALTSWRKAGRAGLGVVASAEAAARSFANVAVGLSDAYQSASSMAQEALGKNVYAYTDAFAYLESNTERLDAEARKVLAGAARD